MKKYVAQYKKEFILGPAFKLAEAILELLVPLVMAKIIDVGVQNGDVPYILKMGGLMVLLGVLGLGFAIICQYCAAVAQQGIGTSTGFTAHHKFPFESGPRQIFQRDAHYPHHQRHQPDSVGRCHAYPLGVPLAVFDCRVAYHGDGARP